MLIVTVLLIILSIFFKFLSSYIKKIRTGDPNESNLTYWMFSYDFISVNKNWVPESKQLLKKKRSRNFLVLVLYLICFAIFLLLNSFTAHLLDIIVNPKFSYPI
jgi:drug/metabolite transporter (DMT)-like permease